MKGIVITTGNILTIQEFPEPLHRSLGETVGGPIEIVHPIGLPEPYCMVVNEEGLLKALPLNRVGCCLYRTCAHGHPIVGNIVLVQEGIVHGEPDIVGIPEETMLQIARVLVASYQMKEGQPCDCIP